jgi:pectin lyase
MDKKDRLRSPDYITISYCKFTNRFWTVAYGTQNNEYTRDRTTLLYNWWNKNVRRCPQLGNGSAHIYNNYYEAYGQKDNGNSTTGIIGGDNSEMLSQNNMFNGYTKGQALTMGGDTKNPARDDNSYISTDLNGSAGKINFSAKKKSSWNPNKTNYGFRLLDAYNNKNTDTKAFCTKYCGCFNSQNGIKYITDSDFSKWTSTIYASPFLTHVDFSDSGKGGEDVKPDPDPSGLTNGSCWRIKNVNSNLYMQVEGAKQQNGTNIQQWGTTGDSVHDIWKLVDAGNGYFYLVSQIGDGNTFYLNVAGNSSNDGANVEIYQSNGGDSQKFMITENSNGSYIIKTKISNNNSAVEVSAYGKNSGDNIQQWSLTGHESQSWIFEPVSNPHAKLRSKNLEKNNSIKNDDEVTKQFVYKEKDCVHTVIFIKSNK